MRTFKGVIFAGGEFILLAPLLIQIVQGRGNLIRMAIPHTKNDRFLFWGAGLNQVVKEVLTHGQDTIGQEQPFFKAGVGVKFTQFFWHNGATRAGIRCTPCQNVRFGNACIVQVYPTQPNLAGGQVAIFRTLSDRVFVDGFAKISQIVRRNLLISLGFRVIFANR